MVHLGESQLPWQKAFLWTNLSGKELWLENTGINFENNSLNPHLSLQMRPQFRENLAETSWSLEPEALNSAAFWLLILRNWKIITVCSIQLLSFTAIYTALHIVKIVRTVEPSRKML